MNTTAVVILNFNGANWLRQFLPSVIRYTPQARILVADNGSTDDSIHVLQTEFPSVQLIRLDKNYGFCGGYNRALAQVKASYYVLLNSDVEVTPGWLHPLTRLLDSDTTLAAVQPKILSYNQKDHFEYAGAAGGCIDALGYPFCRGRLFDYTEKDEGQYNDTREVFWASGACMVIRSDIYHKLGGLDETFFAHMEEIDLCWKIQRAKMKVLYCGESTVYHVGAGTLAKTNPTKTYLNFRNGLNLLVLHLPGWQLLYKLPARIALDYIAALKFLLEGNRLHATGVIKAHYHCVKSLLLTLQKRRALKQKYPFSSRMVYSGSVVYEYFIRGKNQLKV